MRPLLAGLALIGLLAGCSRNTSLIRQQEAQIAFLTQENQQIQERLNAAANRAAELEIELENLRRQRPASGPAAGNSISAAQATALEARIRELEDELTRVETELSRAQAQARQTASSSPASSAISPPPRADQVLHVEVLPTDTYYAPGEARLTSPGVVRLRPILRRLKERFPTQRIRVEGYTDNAVLEPEVKERFPSNWELSVARAAMLVRHMQWTYEMDPTRFEVVGYGHYRPFAPNATEDGRRRNRVVRILVLAD